MNLFPIVSRRTSQLIRTQRVLTQQNCLRIAIRLNHHSVSDNEKIIVEFRNQIQKDSKFVQDLANALDSKEKELLSQQLFVKEHEKEDKYLNINSVPSNYQLMLHGFRNGVPFIGFGFLDNAIMIVAGEYIDSTLGVSFGISTMAAAAIGNWVSDIAGLGAGGFIEAMSTKLRIPDPNLSWKQLQMPKTHVAKALGNMVGITIGCTLGMAPLLFY